MNVKDYRLGFDIWGFVLFLLIMVPNFIWFIIPAPNDILRADSVTEVIDAIGSICQVLMVGSLCVLKNLKRKRIGFTPLIIAVSGCCMLYFAAWVFYYVGFANPMVILGLTIPPCLAFLLFAIDRKNYIAVFSAAGFTVCHLIYAIVNFIV